MEQNKGFWYADWSFPIFVGLLSSGVFAGTHMYYLYGIGAFNEVAFVAMLKAGIDTGVYGAVAAFGASFLFARIIEGSLVGILDIGGAIQTGVGLGVPALLLGAGIMFPVTNFIASLITGLVIGLAIGYVIILARKFTINQSNSTYGADVMMGAGNASGRFLGPLIILSAMTASIPIGVGSLVGALLFYLWQKPITGGAILGAMLLGWRSSRFRFKRDACQPRSGALYRAGAATACPLCNWGSSCLIYSCAVRASPTIP